MECVRGLIEMLMIKKIHFILTISFLILVPVRIYAQPSQVPDASWGSVDHFKYNSSGESETFKNIKLSSKSIAIGQDITVINLDTGNEIATFNVKSITFGRQVKMCWIGNSVGMISDSYITVKECTR